MADDIVGEASAASVAVPMPVEAEPFVATDGQQGVSASVSSDDASNAMPISSDEASKPIVGGDEAAMICEVSVPQDAAFVPSVTPIETTADLGPPLQDAPPPLQGAPLQDAPLQAAPLQDAPPQDAPPQDAPLQDAPLQDAPTQTKASDSDSDSDDDFGIPDRGLYNDDDEDGDEDVGLSRRGGTGTGGATSGAPLRTTHELAKLPAVAPLPFSRLPDDHVMEPLGVVHGTLDDLVIVATGGPRPSHPLDAGSLLCFENRHVIGEVFETLGPVVKPLYSVRIDSNVNPLDEEGAVIGRRVFFAPKHATVVFTESLKLLKGSDASNVDDEEPDEDDVEFSDDEKEMEHKREKKARVRLERSTSSNDANSTTSAASPRPPPAKRAARPLAPPPPNANSSPPVVWPHQMPSYPNYPAVAGYAAPPPIPSGAYPQYARPITTPLPMPGTPFPPQFVALLQQQQQQQALLQQQQQMQQQQMLIHMMQQGQYGAAPVRPPYPPPPRP